MNNIKCIQCGLVNWSSEVECKRCGSLLTVQERLAQQVHVDTPPPKPLFSGGLKFLTAILGLATVALFLSRVLHLIDGETAKLPAVVFMFGGIIFLILTHLWLLVRIFEQSIAWGFGSLMIPLVGLFAVAKFWESTKRSFVGQLVCFGIIFTGYYIVPPDIRP